MKKLIIFLILTLVATVSQSHAFLADPGSSSNPTLVDTGDENATFYPVLVDGATGEQVQETDGELTYNPSTDTWSVGAVSVGNADTTITRTGAGEIAVEGVSILTTDNVTSSDIQVDGTPGSNNTWSGIPFKGINAGEDIEFGELVKLHTDGKWALADKDDGVPAFGYAVECVAPNAFTCQDGEELYVLPLGAAGSIRNDSWTVFVAGDIVYLADDGIFDELADITYSDGDGVQPVGQMQEEDIVIFPVPAWGLDDGT